MGTVSIRELRNKGGEVIDRVEAGEHVTVTRDGRPVAELRPLPSPAPRAADLLEAYRGLPPVDLDQLRAELDEIIDPRL